jgi:hypothetical protein
MENSRKALLEGSNKMSSLITLYFVEKEKLSETGKRYQKTRITP